MLAHRRLTHRLGNNFGRYDRIMNLNSELLSGFGATFIHDPHHQRMLTQLIPGWKPGQCARVLLDLDVFRSGDQGEAQIMVLGIVSAKLVGVKFVKPGVFRW
ncbi:hypothetical protein Y5W_02892 [Alcanivorax sp. 521-1]|uniref:Uncharacterized protein n=1 Tax=Alloalcanivorax profundimaris TaxID=2735259 RepID=A0ABS0AU04_9GAMM|nr:hypothetical protein [Alloalcanivorax profundimaris]